MCAGFSNTLVTDNLSESWGALRASARPHWGAKWGLRWWVCLAECRQLCRDSSRTLRNKGNWRNRAR